MESPQHGTVAAAYPQGGKLRTELLLGHIPQELLAEVGGHGAHFLGNFGVVVGEVGMAGAGVHNAQGVARLGEVVVYLPHHRGGGVGEVNGHRAAHGGAHLVHQAAGLAEVDVLSVLADLGDLNGGKGTLTEEMVDDVAHQHLVGGGGGQAGTGQHAGSGPGVKAAHLMAQLLNLGRHAPHQSGGGVALLRAGEQLVQFYFQGGVALGDDADDIQAVGSGAADHVQIHAAAQHMAVLMVGVVAADLGAAGAAEQSGSSIFGGGESGLELLHRPQSAGAGGSQTAVCPVQGIQAGKDLVTLSGGQGTAQRFTSSHGGHLIYILLYLVYLFFTKNSIWQFAQEFMLNFSS